MIFENLNFREKENTNICYGHCENCIMYDP